MPLDPISVEVVKNPEADLWMRRILASSSVIRLGKVSPSSVGPVGALLEFQAPCILVIPANLLIPVVHFTTCPEVSLGILCNEPVEVVLLGGRVEGNRFHAHRLAVLLGLVLLEGGATNLPRRNVPSADVVPWISPEVIGGGRTTKASSSYKAA